MIYYVYILKINNKSFYAGISSDPVTRIKMHYSDGNQDTNRIIRYNLTKNRICYMHLMYCFSTKWHALTCEELLSNKIANEYPIANKMRGHKIKVPEIRKQRLKMPPDVGLHISNQINSELIPRVELIKGLNKWVNIFVDIRKSKIITI